MGQKIHPIGLRLAIRRNWSSRWYAKNKNFSKMLSEDLDARAFLKAKLKLASIGHIQIDRPAKNARVTVYSARPGVVIGKRGEEIDLLRTSLQKIMGVPVHISIEEIRKPDLDAQIIADSISQQLEKRIMFRRAMKRAMQNAMRLGAQGIKIMSSGRLNGAEIARREWYREGRVPLHTIRANIDYATSEALTTFGIIGVKVWVFKGDLFENIEQQSIPVNSLAIKENEVQKQPKIIKKTEGTSPDSCKPHALKATLSAKKDDANKTNESIKCIRKVGSSNATTE